MVMERMDERTERGGADRDKALDMALSQIDKQFGKGSIMRMGEKGSMAVEAIPTGALALDLALGVGGLPRGRVVEIFGPESSGKTTLCQHVLAEAQRNGGVVAFIDVERHRTGGHRLDRQRALLPHPHDRALAKLLVDLGQRHVQRLVPIRPVALAPITHSLDGHR